MRHTRDAPGLSTSRSVAMVSLLMLAYAMSFVDRQVLALLVEPVTADLRISDTAFGLLQGAAFGIFYIGFGFPLGRIADRGNRRNLIICGMTLWSLATIACGTAGSFGALFAWRAMVGVGEAALSPAAFSIITDAVPKRRLALALAFYSSGLYIGSGMALLAGSGLLGWLTTNAVLTNILPGVNAPWRMVFVVVGLPGLVMSLILLFLPEPPRRHFTGQADGHLPTIREAFALVVTERKLFAGFTFGFACHNLSIYALLGWFPGFVGRHYAIEPTAFGSSLGMATIVSGVLGLIAGGLIGDRWTARGSSDVPIRMAIMSLLATTLAIGLAVNTREFALTVTLYGAAVFSLATPIGTAAAALQLVVPNRFRGQISALYLVTISLVGLSLGPLLPPLINDTLFGDKDRIGDALWITLAGTSITGTAILLIGRPAYMSRYAAIHLADKKKEAAVGQVACGQGLPRV